MGDHDQASGGGWAGLVDVGVNLTSSRFERDRDEVVARARAAGVAGLVVTGVDERGSREALALCGRYRGSGVGVWCTAGVHPHDSAGVAGDAGWVGRLRALCGEGRGAVVAVGECGLDYERDYSPRAAQRAAFEAQLDLAAELGLPVFLHERGAHEEFFSILSGRWGALRGGVVHCFTGGPAALERYLGLGCYVGVTGWVCDERRAGDLRAAAAGLPLGRVLVETDAPYLLPRTLRPRPRDGRNEPSLLPHVVESLAGFMGVGAGELGRASAENARALFGLEGLEGAAGRAQGGGR